MKDKKISEANCKQFFISPTMYVSFPMQYGSWGKRICFLHSFCLAQTRYLINVYWIDQPISRLKETNCSNQFYSTFVHNTSIAKKRILKKYIYMSTKFPLGHCYRIPSRSEYLFSCLLWQLSKERKVLSYMLQWI